MNFHAIFPLIEPWVKHLAFAFPAWIVKPSIWIFAVVEAFHLLFLAGLGGCVLILGLRLMGVTMTSVPSEVIERNVRPWIKGAILGVFLTGVVIGMSNAEKLYDSPAFFLKMISMFGAMILSLGVTNFFARNQASDHRPAQYVASVAANLWFLFALGMLIEGKVYLALTLVIVGGLAAAAPNGGSSRQPALFIVAATAAAWLAMKFVPVLAVIETRDAADKVLSTALSWRPMSEETQIGLAGFVAVIASEALRAVTMRRLWLARDAHESAAYGFTFAVALWAVAVWVFATATGTNPGTFHIVCAGFLLAMGIGGFRTRAAIGATVVVIVVAAGISTYGFFNFNDVNHPENLGIFMSINKWAVRAIALLSVATLGWEMFGPKAPTASPATAKLVGLFTILAWVTVAAGGRWIGLS